MDDELEARLESHDRAFEGLLSLIPAEDYYAKDNSDQWQRKKQTKEEKRAARKAKLDPANRKSALDITVENEKKRKRELGLDSASEHENNASAASGRAVKKNRTESTVDNSSAGIDAITTGRIKAEKRRDKRQRQKEKAERKKRKAEVKKARTGGGVADQSNSAAVEKDNIESPGGFDQAISEHVIAPLKDLVSEDAERPADELDIMDTSGLLDEDNHVASTATSPISDSPAFNMSANQSSSSSTSIVPPTDTSGLPTTLESQRLEKALERHAEPIPSSVHSPVSNHTASIHIAQEQAKPAKQKPLALRNVNQDELRARLQARVEELRAKRKADGPDGQPVRSRQDLLDARRRKSEARKAHKKALRQKAKAEEEMLNQERLKGGGSPLSVDIFSPRQETNSFSFGRVAFEDGATAGASLETLVEPKKRKGPQDVKTALQAAEKKAARLNSYDADKREEIESKDAWLNAKKRVYGEKVKDDTSLLRKALKRKEKQKGKSEKEWQEREESVRKGKEQRQRKREENIAKRKEEKGGKKREGKGKPGGAKKGKPKGRPGFEGK